MTRCRVLSYNVGLFLRKKGHLGSFQALLKFFWNALGMPLECPWNALGMPLECSWNAPRMPLECSWIAFQMLFLLNGL